MTEPSELAALLLQLTDLSGKLAALDQRQAGDTSEIRARLAALAALAEALKGTIADQAKILASLAGIDETVAALADRLADSGPAGAGGGYKPAPAPRFWKLTGPDREQAISRLRSWADQIYRPGYGSLAAGLGAVLAEPPPVPVRPGLAQRAMEPALPARRPHPGSPGRPGRMADPAHARYRRPDEPGNPHLP